MSYPHHVPSAVLFLGSIFPRKFGLVCRRRDRTDERVHSGDAGTVWDVLYLSILTFNTDITVFIFNNLTSLLMVNSKSKYIL